MPWETWGTLKNSQVQKNWNKYSCWGIVETKVCQDLKDKYNDISDIKNSTNSKDKY